MSSDIFRSEAIKAQENAYGMPSRLSPPAGWLVTAIFISICAIGSLFLIFGKYSRRESVRGVVLPVTGLPFIVAPRAGVVGAVNLSEGESVQKGDLVFRMSAEDITSNGTRVNYSRRNLWEIQRASKADEQAAEEQKLRLRVNDLAQKIRDLQQLSEQAASSLTFQSERLRLAQKTVRDVTPLRSSQYISELEYQRHVLSEIEAKRAVALARSELTNSRMAESAALAERTSLEEEIRLIRARHISAIAQIDDQGLTVDSEGFFALEAPASGRLASIAVKSGEFVSAGATMATIVPPGSDLIVQLEVPSKAIGFVRRGDQVKIMFDAFPYQRFGFGSGVVQSVSETPVSETRAPGTNEAVALFFVKIKLHRSDVDAYGKSWQLAPGMQVGADIILERRTFLEWILDPVIAARKRG